MLWWVVECLSGKHTMYLFVYTRLPYKDWYKVHWNTHNTCSYYNRYSVPPPGWYTLTDTSGSLTRAHCDPLFGWYTRLPYKGSLRPLVWYSVREHPLWGKGNPEQKGTVVGMVTTGLPCFTLAINIYKTPWMIVFEHYCHITSNSLYFWHSSSDSTLWGFHWIFWCDLVSKDSPVMSW